MMIFFQRRKLQLKNFDNLQLFVKMFTMHNMSAPYKWGIPVLKDSYAHVIHDPIERNQGVV